MNVPELFIRRPVMTTLVTLGITIFGMMAYRTLPVSDLPTVDFPTMLIGPWRNSKKWNGSLCVSVISFILRFTSQASP